MEYYPLDITIISADGIKNVNIFSKMDVYAVVKILGYTKNKKKTNVDKNSGTSPKWNFHMRLNIEEASLNNPGISLLIQLKSDRTFGSDKEIGEVNIPIPELYNGVSAVEKEDPAGKVVDYQVRTSSGKPKGTLKFSYKFGEKFFQEKVEGKKKKKHVDGPMTAYPAPPEHAAGSSTAYPQYPQLGYAMPPPGYQMPPPHGGYAVPPPGYGGYPPAGYPHAAPSGYGYPPPPGYGYPPPMMQAQPPKKNKGMGLGLGMGLLGGLLVGDMIADVGEMAAYDAGYEDAMGF